MRKLPASYPIALLIAVFALLPFAVLVELAADGGPWFDSHNIQVLINTLMLMVLTGVGAVLIGVPLAVLLAFVNVPFKRFWLVLFSAPLALPSYLGAFTMYFSFGQGGELETLFGVSFPALEGLTGAALVMSLYTYPFVLMTTRSALLSVDTSMINAARTLGLPVMTCLWRLVLPRVVNSIAAGALLAVLYALSDFGTPAIMGFDTFTRVIFVEYNAFGLSQAAMLSLQLMVLVGLVLFLEARVKAHKERPGKPLAIWLSKTTVGAVLVLFLPVILLSIVLPLGIFVVWLLREGVSGFDLSFAWNSAYASMLAAIAAVVLALPVAYAALAGRAGRIMERVTFLGFGVPGIVMGTALVYLGLKLPFLYQSLGLLVLAYVLRFLPLAVGTVRATAESLDGSLTKAAKVLGASNFEAFWRVSVPLTTRGIVAGAALVFLEAMRELPATLMLGPTGFETLATYLWRVYEAGYFGRAAVPGLLLILLSGLGLIIMLSGERHADIVGDKEK